MSYKKQEYTENRCSLKDKKAGYSLDGGQRNSNFIETQFG